jgi:hypothetical protein
MLLKRSNLAFDMTSENMYKIKSKYCTRHVLRQLAFVLRVEKCSEHIFVPMVPFHKLQPYTLSSSFII